MSFMAWGITRQTMAEDILDSGLEVRETVKEKFLTRRARSHIRTVLRTNKYHGLGTIPLKNGGKLVGS